MRTFNFTIYGRPQQRGSKQAVLIPKRGGGWVEKNGRPIVAAKDDNPRSKEWMGMVSQQCGEIMHQSGETPIVGAVRLTIGFYFRRPKGHYGSGKRSHILKDSSPQFHVGTPDIDKLVRCLGDALTGVVFDDDRQICELVAKRFWTEDQERAEVYVEELSDVPYKREPKPKAVQPKRAADLDRPDLFSAPVPTHSAPPPF